MKLKNSLKLSFIVLLALFFILFYFIFLPKINSIDPDISYVNLDKDSFYSGIQKVDSSTKESYQIKAAIIPHHLVASYMIADLFYKLSFQQIDRIILIGPNHFEKGESLFITSNNDWKTDFGFIKADQEFITNLENYNVKINSGVVEGDHSITELLPFANYYIKDFKIVPIIISAKTSQKDLDNLINNLKNLINPNDVIISSIDFSHYLASTQSDQKDIETLNLIEKKDYSQIMNLGNDHLDSPASLTLVMKLMQELNINQNKILFHDNSGNILDKKWDQGTSYYSIIYY